jgi:hypothetical protein
MEFRAKQILPPKSWEEFEDLCLALFKSEWRNPLVQKHGRKGQAQQGVDIFGNPTGSNGIHGIQCKGKDQTYGNPATETELRAEIAKAEMFTPPLRHWVFATTANVDAPLQAVARTISSEREKLGKFPVTVLGWGDIQSLIADNPKVLEAFYPEQAFDIPEILRTIRSLPKSQDILSFKAALESAKAQIVGAPVWETVSFGKTRDLRPALMGRPLGPADVVACPAISEAESLVQELERAYGVRLIGESGAGKTVCALQAAYRLAERGWAVLRLSDPATLRVDPPLTAGPTLLIVDDAHLAPLSSLRSLEMQTNEHLFLLTTHSTNDAGAVGPGSIRLDSKRAVGEIADGLRVTWASTNKAVRAVDDRVGDHPHDESLDFRLTQAEQGSDRPWQFCFILGGGWRRAGQSAASARSAGADIVLAAVAAHQIASLDSRLERRELLSLLQSTGVVQDADHAIDWLLKERLLISATDMRCPHQRFASVVLERLFEGQDAAAHHDVSSILHAVLTKASLPLRGQYTLTRELAFAGSYGRWKKLVRQDTLADLLERCWQAASGVDRASALFIFSDLDGYVEGWPHAVLEGRVDQVSTWINEYEDPMGYAIRHFMNALRDEKALVASITSNVDPVRIARAVSEVTPQTAYHLAELKVGMTSSASESWKTSFSVSLDRDACLAVASSWPTDGSLYAFSQFCEAFAYDETEFSLDLVEAFLPTLAPLLVQQPLETFRSVDDLAWHVLRVLDPLNIYVGARAPTKRMKQLAKAMCEPLRPVDLARVISKVDKRDFQTAAFLLSFMRKASPGKAAATVNAIDWLAIESTVGDDWDNLFHDAQVFLAQCHGAMKPSAEIAALIERNLPRIRTLTPRLAIMAPNAAYRHVEEGGCISLTAYGHCEWNMCAGVIAYFAENRPELVETLLAPHEVPIASILSQRNSSWFREITSFLRVVRQIAPASLDRILCGIDVAAAEFGWADSLKSTGSARRGVALLVELAMPRNDSVGHMARRLRGRFPAGSKPLASDLKPIEES